MSIKVTVPRSAWQTLTPHLLSPCIRAISIQYQKKKSDLDIELYSGTDDKTFLTTLAEHLDKIIKATKPDIFFLQAGCDTLDGDPLASLKMSAEGIAKRDMMVIDACAKHKIPVVITLEGWLQSNSMESAV